AALREGRPLQAARLVADARMLDTRRDGTTQIRSVADEVERVLAEAGSWWSAATAARAANRYTEVLALTEKLRATACDVPPPTGYDVGLEALAAEARAAVAEADRLVGTAAAAAPLERVRLLGQALARCADHESATRQLAAVPVPAPTGVAARRLPNGSVLVTWSAPTTERADYRVTALRPDGSWRVVGRTHTTEIEDGGAPAGEIPVYAVATALAGRYSEPARSDAPGRPATARPATARPATASPTPSTGRIDYTRPSRPRQHAQADQVTPAGSERSAPATGAGRPGPAAESTVDHAATTRIVPAGQPTAGGRDAAPGERAGASAPAEGEGRTGGASSAADLPTDPTPGGIPAVAGLAEHDGLLVFDWPAGITEVMVVVRADRPPLTHDEPGARAWKVTNMRYQIDGGVAIPAEVPRPCHVAVASCRREPDGRLRVAPGVAPAARMHWPHPA